MKYFKGKAQWNKAFETGVWDYLTSDFSELMRLSFISAVIHTVERNSFVMDLGCGEGLIAQYFDADKYIGIDLSDNAIHRAKIRFPNYKFKTAGIGEDEFQKKYQDILYNIIVLNEVLYYLNDEEFQILLNFISQSFRSGKLKFLVVSICKTDQQKIHHSSYYWSKLFKSFRHEHSINLSDEKHFWEVKIFGPKKP